MALAPAVRARRVANAWVLPPELAAAARAAAATWRGDAQPQVTRQQPIGPGTIWLGRKARERYGAPPGGAPGSGLIYQTYARGRTLVAGQRSSMHHTGRAIDLMIREVRGAPNRAGDAVANWLVANSRAMGVQYLIWAGTQWSSATGLQSVYPGSEDHFNHIHVDLSVAGALARTPFYAGIDPLLVGGRSMETAPLGEGTPTIEDPVADLTITPAEAGITEPGGGGARDALMTGVALGVGGYGGYKLGQWLGWWR